MLPVISDPESLTTPGADPAAEAGARFDVLADRRRRAILRYLDEDGGPVSLSDLADHLVLKDHADAKSALASCGDALFGTRRRVLLSLRHSHVPKLADVDAVDFQQESNTVSLGARSDELLARANSIDDDVDRASQSEPVFQGSAQ